MSSRVGLLGYGEVGRIVAHALATHAVVQVFDPAYPPTKTSGMSLLGSAGEAVTGADVVLAVTPGRNSIEAAQQAAPDLAPGALYVDLSTSDPAGKREVSQIVADAGSVMADGAIMAPITLRGFRTPVIASGAGADRFAQVASAWGMDVTSIDGSAGDAAARKLLRSVVVKGLSALVIESLRAAERAGVQEWFGEHLLETITEADDDFLIRLLTGAGNHSIRRQHEMQAAAAMLADLGVDPTMTRATSDVLATVDGQGVPALPRRQGGRP